MEMMIASGLFIFLGLLLICIALIGVFYYLGEFLMYCFLGGIRALFSLGYHATNKKRISPEYLEYQENKLEQERIAKEAQQAKEDADKKKEAHDRYVDFLTDRVNDLKMKYPLADKHLFDEFVNTFATRPLDESKQIAENIRKSHEEKLTKTNSYNEEKKYELHEVLFFDKVDEDSYKEISVTIYKKDLDYVVVVSNSKTNSNIMYVTQNAVLADKMMKQIIGRCRNKDVQNLVKAEEDTILKSSEVSDLMAYTINMLNIN